MAPQPTASAGASPAKLTGSQARKQKRDAGTPGVKAPPMYDESSRQLAALGYGLLVLLAAPILSLDYPLEGGGIKFYQFSATHVASLAILDHAPPLAALARGIMMPAAYMQRISMTVKHCMDHDPVRCDWWPLTNTTLMTQEADLTHVLPEFQKAFSPNHLTLLYIGGIVVTFGAIAGLYRPVRLGVLGFFLMVYAAYFTADAGLLPTLVMEAFLGGYVLLFSPEGLQKEAEAKAKKAAAKKAAAQAKKDSAASPAATSSASPGGAASQRKGSKTLDKKSLYDI